ncbi:peptidyl-prolyl cis-trans isomerase 9-like isoform X1 [Olea europaea var. sylvestris]|uniref:peptidyl-prolyl cis-trans isomerase 9-like isoform X1 n=1 Tax=Olea europaea var. sylvestris TaxID=158386 RepID=UPI000C1D7E15|nr:peptidyl-prolyl cis-trans isomerase 9-like isoform X1 [Olea europaea var. sylvestris]
MASFTVEMYYDYAPKTCKNFIELARRGYYDNVKFHRIIKISLILYCKVGIQLGLAGVANQFMGSETSCREETETSTSPPLLWLCLYVAVPDLQDFF